MALLFRTELGGGSSIEPYIVNVTCVPSMVGKTVTMTQGSTVLSKICPSSLEVTFKPMNDGLWTVECEGSTKDVTLLAWGTYNVSISWGLSGWLETIGKTTTETSLLAYLNDVNNQADIRELMTRHVSADYLYDWYANIPSVLDDVMASTYGAKWLGLRDYVCDKFMANETAKSTMLNSDNWEYILKDNVPIMTSNTAPYGTAFGHKESQPNYHNFYRVFDGNATDTNSLWLADYASESYIGYKFVNPINVNKVMVLEEPLVIDAGKNYVAHTIYVQMYDYDVSNWITIGQYDYGTELDERKTKQYVDCDNTKYSNKYRILYGNATYRTSSTYVNMTELQFYGRELKVSIPTMTSNTEPWGVVTATDYYKDNYISYDPWRAFANGTECGWLPANFNDELVYDFGYPVLVKKMTLRNAKQASTETSKVYYDLFGSIDGQKYDLIQNDVNCYTHRNDLFTYSINTNKYRFYKLVCTKNDNGRATSGYGCILQLYGLDYSEREFAENSKVEYIYDHGIELMALTKTSSSALVTFDTTNCKTLRATLGKYATTSDKIQCGSANATLNGNPFSLGLDITNVNGNNATGFGNINVANMGDTSLWVENK